MKKENEESLKKLFERVKEIIETNEYPLLVDKFGAMRACVDDADRIIYGE